jgi:hypothetical protein
MFDKARTLIPAGGLLLAVAWSLVPAPTDAQSKCRPVSGSLVSELLSGPECLSPVGLCTRGRLLGEISAPFVFTATSLVPSNDTALTGVVHYTGDMVVTARGGDMFLKEAGGFNAVPNSTGDAAAVSTIIGGNGEHVGVSGRLRIAGTFTPQEGGSSKYQGQICRE